MFERFDRIIISVVVGVIAMVASAFVTVGIVGYGFEKPEFTPFAALFIAIGILSGWATFRIRYSNSFDDLCKQYPNGMMDWAIEKQLIKNYTDDPKRINYKFKVEAVKSEKSIIIKEQRIRDQYDALRTKTPSAVFDQYSRRYRRNKYEIIRHTDEISQAVIRYRKAEKEKQINNKYNELKKKYPKGLPNLEKFYSYDDGKNSAELTKEEIVEREDEIRKFEEYADTASEYMKWEADQRAFSSRCVTLAKEVFPNFGRYIYDAPYNRPDIFGKTIKWKFRVWQFFPSSICIDKDVKTLSLLPNVLANTLYLPEYKNHKLTFSEETYQKIISFIKKLGEEKDILVYFNSESPDWTIEEQWNQLNPIITHEHNWEEYDPLTDEMIGAKSDDEFDVLTGFKGKFIVVVDAMTENENLKNICKRIREVYDAKAPHICYISLLKCYDKDEADKQIQAVKDETLKEIQEKQKEADAQKKLIESVSNWDTLVGGLKYSYLFYYYPTTCDFEATEEEWSNRWIVWDFKNTPGKTSAADHQEALGKAIPMVKNKLTSTFGADNLKYLTLVCIPASSQVKTQARYEEFSNRICGETGLINAYPHISVVTEREERHLGGSSMNTGQLSFDDDFFKGKYVLLFDDVITRGDSMRTFKRKMESLGAIVVGGLSLGKTKHERPTQGSIPNPFSRPVFPPQPTTTSDDDDLPF